MPHLYPYIGPPELRHGWDECSQRHIISTIAEIDLWNAIQPKSRHEQRLTASFIIDPTAQLWIADQRSEHVACARGGHVLAAGEITFIVEAGLLVNCELTNQSTGYCPEPSTWSVVQEVLDHIGLPHAGGWAKSYDFRRCPACDMINLIKDQWFVCAVCEHELPLEWNC